MQDSENGPSDILARIEKLDPDAQLQLLEEIARIVRSHLHGKKRSIAELKGLGKEIWSGEDAQEYVNRERATWEG